MATILEPNKTDESEFVEYALVTDATTATLAAAFSQILDRLRSGQGRAGEEGVAIRLAAQVRQAVQWRRSAHSVDWDDVWVSPEARMQ